MKLDASMIEEVSVVRNKPKVVKISKKLSEHSLTKMTKRSFKQSQINER